MRSSMRVIAIVFKDGIIPQRFLKQKRKCLQKNICVIFDISL